MKVYLLLELEIQGSANVIGVFKRYSTACLERDMRNLENEYTGSIFHVQIWDVEQ